MVISSIDLKDGHVVQLKNGAELKIQRDDADELIKEFDKYGEVAIIDLDAALGNTNADGTTANTALLKKLLRHGNVRVGGGIRDVKKARELISLGAEKVIIGSRAWKKNYDGGAGASASASGGVSAGASASASGDASASANSSVSAGDSPLDTEFLEQLAAAIGKQRIIISVDAIEGKIAVKGWTETVDVPLVEGAKLAEKYCSELLFTCVEKEGCMQGTNMEMVRSLREAVSCRVVAAGGVSSVEEIEMLEKMGCDVQLGMALYTGAVKLDDAFIACLNWKKVPLVPVIAQDECGEVLMMGYANREAFKKTFATGKLTFFSRTRNVLWTKGENSGHFLQVVRLRVDCDRDTVLATVVPHGGVCHTGSYTCFKSVPDAASSLGRLYGVIAERFANPKPGSYTATLDATRVREKIEEEAEELCEAETHEDVVWEVADLIYFMSVLMYKENVTWKDVCDELDRRHKEK